MIFVTVGGNRFDFSRLIKAMDEIAGKIDEEVRMQIGSSMYIPKNAKYFDFTSSEEMEKLYAQARVIIAHAGAGTIINILKHGKPAIIVPRRKEYDELLDGHQIELAMALDEMRGIKVVYDVEGLEKALKDLDELDIKTVHTGKDMRFINSLRRYLKDLESSEVRSK